MCVLYYPYFLKLYIAGMVNHQRKHTVRTFSWTKNVDYVTLETTKPMLGRTLLVAEY
jgi:hypothetical protein